MNFVVIGTDHRFQHSEAGLSGLLQGWIVLHYPEPLIAIAEEHHKDIGNTSVAQVLAEKHGLHWCNLDMTPKEKQDAGIFEDQRSRPSTTARVCSDDIREDAWVGKLTQPGSGTVLVICGFLHLESLVQKLRDKGHGVDKRVYLETVPEIEIPDCQKLAASSLPLS